MIIDCHVHIANRMTGLVQPLRYGKVRDGNRIRQFLPPAFDPTASPAEVLLGYMDQAGVDHAVIVNHHLYGDQNAATLEAVKRWPDRFSGFADLGDMDQPEVPDQLERLLGEGLAGLKIEVGITRRLRADFRFDGERERRVFERLNQLRSRLILDLNNATPEDIPALRRLIEDCPNVRLVVCHLGGAPRPGWEERALLATHPRVWVDLASLQAPFGPDHEYPYPEAQKLVQWAVQHLSADKMMWGTDYPGNLNYGTYRQLLDWVRRHCAFLTAEQKQMILGGAAQKFLAEA